MATWGHKSGIKLPSERQLRLDDPAGEAIGGGGYSYDQLIIQEVLDWSPPSSLPRLDNNHPAFER